MTNVIQFPQNNRPRHMSLATCKALFTEAVAECGVEAVEFTDAELVDLRKIFEQDDRDAIIRTTIGYCEQATVALQQMLSDIKASR